LKRKTQRAASAAEDQEEHDVLEMDLYYFREWHLEVINRYNIAKQKLVKFEEENASLKNALSWSVLLHMLSKDNSESDDDEVVTDLLQSMNTSPSPQAPSTEAPAVAAREDSPVEHSEAEEEEEKAEYEVKEEHYEK
jgi:hypothetical protein